MSLFRKKEKTHFERDEEGQVVRVTRNGQTVDPQELKMKSAQQLEQEYYTKHPEKRHPTLKKVGSGLAKIDKKVVEYNRRSNILNTQRTGIRRPSARPVQGITFGGAGSVFDVPKPRKKKKSRTQFTVIKGKAYPIAGTGHKKKKHKGKKRRSSKPNFGGIPGFDNSRWF